MKYYTIEVVHNKAVGIRRFDDMEEAISNFKELAEENGCDLLFVGDYFTVLEFNLCEGFWECDGYSVTLTMAD